MFAQKILRTITKSLSLLVLLTAIACGGGGGDGGNPDPSNNTLDVTITGSGTITSSPAGINCGNDCSQDFSNSTSVTLTATADEGFTFDRWEGACTGNGSCIVSMSSDQNVRAIFIEVDNNHYTLTVTVTGSGVITSNPEGINCQSDCSEDYLANTTVTLTATPGQGFVLDHWQGACTGNRNCVISMNADKSVSAVFAVESQHSVLIENYSAPNDAFQLGEIPADASGITWHTGLEEYLVVRNNAARIYRYDVNFAFLGSLNVTNIDTDTEGLAYVNNNEVLVVSESNTASRVTIDSSTESVNGQPPTSQRYQILEQQGGNQGLEGIAVRKPTASTPARVFACKEGGGGNNLKVVYFDMPEDSASVYDQQTNLTVEEPFNAVDAFSMVVRDLAGMVYDERTDHLIIVSQQSSKAIQVHPYTGAVISELLLDGAPQYEGVTLGPNNELVFVSEGNWIRIYTEN